MRRDKEASSASVATAAGAGPASNCSPARSTIAFAESTLSRFYAGSILWSARSSPAGFCCWFSLPPLLMGTRGHAKIAADPSPLRRRAARYWKRTFGM